MRSRWSGGRGYFVAAVVLGVVLLAGGAVFVLRGGDEAAPAPAPEVGHVAQSGPSPASYSSSPSDEVYAALADRAGDPKPLTEREAFPSAAKKLDADGVPGTLTRRAERLDADCTAAVWGRGVAAELMRGGCTQAARTLYAAPDPEPGHVLSVTVFNLAGREEAERLVAGLDAARGAGFVLPLTAKDAGQGFGRGFGMARGLALGHYAVVAWAERLDGRGAESDEALLSLLIAGGQPPAVLNRAARTR
ncbi:hypothetical protein [Actinomadura flavalba]|uniref:hypothetical protein n=1 Tax=Actinomadura flavalba TaxID=1120938 RepID=UPI0012DDBFBC|nr:hypothetical protein [Actinomadura flavalba]